MADEAATRSSTTRTVWEAVAQGWDERHAYFDRVARPVVERMIEGVAPSPGQTLLDVAAGTGVVGFAAAALVQPGGRVIVSDFSPQMVAAAARHGAQLGLDNVEYRLLDAEQLDLPDGSVDAAMCRWGYMLMPDPAAALAETRRVLVDGGRLSFGVFTSGADNPWVATPMQVLMEQGHAQPPAPGAPGILALADEGRVRDLLAGAGFSEPTLETVAFSFRFSGADDYWAFLNEAAGPIAMILKTLSSDAAGAVRAELTRRLAAFDSDGEMSLPATSWVVTASAPG
jgi:ubiquinone/menaquinone biosynthesis C-methylase UbiE